MKKINIAIAFDEEKLTALKMYLGQKNMTVEKELEKALEALYGKTVPAGVREYLALRTEAPTDKKKPITAEEEHRQEVDEVTDMITTEDVVEQAVYIANAPDCCADEHAENMLGMLGANIIEPEIYHDEDECPNREDEIEEEELDSLEEASPLALTM